MTTMTGPGAGWATVHEWYEDLEGSPGGSMIHVAHRGDEEGVHAELSRIDAVGTDETGAFVLTSEPVQVYIDRGDAILAQFDLTYARHGVHDLPGVTPADMVTVRGLVAELIAAHDAG